MRSAAAGTGVWVQRLDGSLVLRRGPRADGYAPADGYSPADGYAPAGGYAADGSAPPAAAGSGAPAARAPSELPRRLGGLKPPVFRVLPAVSESVGAARQLARRLIGEQNPVADAFVLCVSELVTNAVTHTRSAVPGGSITIVLCLGESGALVQVRDDGGASAPRVIDELDPYSEHGRGLQLVAALADHWGSVCTPQGRVTWCRLNPPA